MYSQIHTLLSIICLYYQLLSIRVSIFLSVYLCTRKKCCKMLVALLLSPQHCMLTAYACCTLCMWLCYIEVQQPQLVLSISTGISQSCHPCAGEADAKASPPNPLLYRPCSSL